MSAVLKCVKSFHSNKSNFSIDHILNVAGEKQSVDNFQFSKDVIENKKFDWLNCTRYRPPKLPRQRKKEGLTRRKMGRNPRVPFSSSQVAFLEAKFHRTRYLSSSDVTELANYLKLSETRVKIWFQNRRARERREKDSKSKPSESSMQSELKFKSSSQTAILALDFPKGFTLNYNDSFRHPERPQLGHSLLISAPSDLGEQQIVYRCNNLWQ